MNAEKLYHECVDKWGFLREKGTRNITVYESSVVLLLHPCYIFMTTNILFISTEKVNYVQVSGNIDFSH